MKNKHVPLLVTETDSSSSCENTTFFFLKYGGKYEPPYNITPTKGFHDFRQCEGCKLLLKQLISSFQAIFVGDNTRKGFPFCCEHHANLVKLNQFRKGHFANAPSMAARKIIYTYQHIVNSHNKSNWYQETTDYIEWAIESFGDMPQGCGSTLFLREFLSVIKKLLINNVEYDIQKKQQILDFLQSAEDSQESFHNEVGHLIDIYQKWLDLFPFELNTYFGKIKSHYHNQLFILKGKTEKNIYSKSIRAIIHTKSSLLQALISLTERLLTETNGITIFEQGLITDANKIKLELAITSRRLKLKQGYSNIIPDDQLVFQSMVNEWLNDEKVFINEITPLLFTTPSQEAERKTEQEQPKTFEELFYNPVNAEPCLKILSELQPPVIDAINNYIGKAKGVFPLWVKVLKNHKPEPLIKHFKDTVYKDLLNQKVNGLNLTKDASEFRKQYVRLENDKIELDIKTILSQYSQSGKLGK